MSSSFSYPAVYDGAGKISAQSQLMYLWLLRVEYSLLIIAAALSLASDGLAWHPAGYAGVLLLSLVTLLIRFFLKPEEGWYKGRSLAESVKTMTWRYCMRAAPFEDVSNVKIKRAEFRNQLRSVLDANRHIGNKLPPDSAANDQVTSSMEDVRALDLEARKCYYLDRRIREQRKWYQSKAAANRRGGRNWVFICVVVYVVAIAAVLMQVADSSWRSWPTEPLIVVASSIVGWIQIKRFNELASAYTLTAHEIGILQGGITEIESEDAFSDFVNEAELAFSREHTQWSARQNFQ